MIPGLERLRKVFRVDITAAKIAGVADRCDRTCGWNRTGEQG